MPDVFNWHLGRNMAYQLNAARPKKQFAMMMDTNKCIGCQTCTMNCKQTWTWGKGQEYMLWNNVESKPYGFYPTAWDVKLLEKLGAQKWDATGKYAGKTIFEAVPPAERLEGWLPEDEDWSHPNIGEDEPHGKTSKGTYLPGIPHSQLWMFHLQRICNHCTYPGCVAACPRGAIYKRPEDGIVLIDQGRCRGYRECVRGCPYKKTMFNNETRISEKCVACYPAIEQGTQNQCVLGCIGRIRLTGFVSTPEKADATNPVDFLVHVRKVALPLYPQFGTEPNVYYLPPIHAPLPYLRQMFGPAVDKAVQTYKNIPQDLELQGLLMLFGATTKIIHRFKVEKGIAIGFDEKGAEIVRVPVKEPTYIRAYQDAKTGAYRHNIT